MKSLDEKHTEWETFHVEANQFLQDNFPNEVGYALVFQTSFLFKDVKMYPTRNEAEKAQMRLMLDGHKFTCVIPRGVPKDTGKHGYTLCNF